MQLEKSKEPLERQHCSTSIPARCAADEELGVQRSTQAVSSMQAAMSWARFTGSRYPEKPHFPGIVRMPGRRLCLALTPGHDRSPSSAVEHQRRLESSWSRPDRRGLIGRVSRRLRPSSCWRTTWARSVALTFPPNSERYPGARSYVIEAVGVVLSLGTRAHAHSVSLAAITKVDYAATKTNGSCSRTYSPVTRTPSASSFSDMAANARRLRADF